VPAEITSPKPERFSFHLNHPPFLNRQRKSRAIFPAFAKRFFVWNRWRAIRNEICAVLCSYRNVLAALSLPNKIYNFICSMQGLSLMPTLQVKKISRQGSTNSTGSNEGSSRFESPSPSFFHPCEHQREIFASEPVFVDLLRRPGIDSQPGGPVRQPCLSYRPARLHRLIDPIPGLRKRLQIRAGFGVHVAKKPRKTTYLWFNRVPELYSLYKDPDPLKCALILQYRSESVFFIFLLFLQVKRKCSSH
jgi:hypothetical protein